MFGKMCKFGGECTDPGNPSDCEMNNRCFNFKSMSEKEAFDALPDKYILEQQG